MVIIMLGRAWEGLGKGLGRAWEGLGKGVGCESLLCVCSGLWCCVVDRCLCAVLSGVGLAPMFRQ